MARSRKKYKCMNCRDLFIPDHRNVKRQKYCPKPECRKASKAVSQRRWLAKKENRDYFKGAENVLRVQKWRKAHPGYWRRGKADSEPAIIRTTTPKSSPKQPDNKSSPGQETALQDPLTGFFVINHQDSATLVHGKVALQDSLMAQHYVLTGIIALLTGSTLQDDIVHSTQALQQSGCDILESVENGVLAPGVSHAGQTSSLPGTHPPGS